MKNDHDLYRIKGTVTIANDDLTKPRTQVIKVDKLFADNHPFEAMNQATNEIAPSYANITVIDDDLDWELATPEEVTAWETAEDAANMAKYSEPLFALP